MDIIGIHKQVEGNGTEEAWTIPPMHPNRGVAASKDAVFLNAEEYINKQQK